MISKTDVKNATSKYWDECFDKNNMKPEDRLNYYINNLLPLEIEYREQIKNKPFKYTSPVDYLVLLIGYSYEPLLQSILYYQPCYIVPVISEKYSEKTSGEDMFNRLEEVVGELANNFKMNSPEFYPKPEDIDYIKSKPDKVFQNLLNNPVLVLNQRNKNVVIDITGAKKSMVSGVWKSN